MVLDIGVGRFRMWRDKLVGKRVGAHNRAFCKIKIAAMTASTSPVVCWHPANKIGRDLVVGDLHGCVDALRYLLSEIGFDGSRDPLVSVGRLVGRRSDSLAGIELLDKPWFCPVLGKQQG